jgi:hypothetical protein
MADHSRVRGDLLDPSQWFHGLQVVSRNQKMVQRNSTRAALSLA